MIELIERWNTPKGKVVYDNVLKAFRNKKPLASVEGLEKYNNRWDLRGFCFPIPKVLDTFMYKELKVEKFRGFNIEYAKLHDIDFSYAILYRTVWKWCTFKNVLFHTTEFVQSSFWNCDFEHIRFSNSEFKDAILGGMIASLSGSFKNSDFSECNFTQVYFHSPEIKDCNFINCNL